jgi:hypothetical protein
VRYTCGAVFTLFSLETAPQVWRAFLCETSPTIDQIDYFVLTTRDRAACVRFYTDVLGMQLETFGPSDAPRWAFRFGNQKINLHERGRELEPRAHLLVPGALDLCFIASVPLEAASERLAPRAGRLSKAPFGAQSRAQRSARSTCATRI